MKLNAVHGQCISTPNEPYIEDYEPMRRKSGAILSNGSVDMLTSAVKSAGMEDVIDHLISVDPIRLFKTSPESYELVQEAIPVNKDEVLFVSSNAWDALGATWFCFTTHWVNRQGLPFEALSPRPHFLGPDLNSVLVSLDSTKKF